LCYELEFFNRDYRIAAGKGEKEDGGREEYVNGKGLGVGKDWEWKRG